MEFVVDTYQPMRLCENAKFRKLLEAHNSEAHHIDRETLRNMIRQEATSLRAVCVEACKRQHLAITTDCWTSVANESYISLTAHFIDENWKLTELDLCCDPFPGSHIAPVIAAKVQELHLKFGITDEQVVCCVTDNEPTNNAAADSMSYEWIGCVDHLVELTTGIAFNGIGTSDVMSKCRKLVGHFTSSSQAQEALERIQLATHQEPLKVVQDVATRWWSTHSMVHRLLKLESDICQMAIKNKRVADLNLSVTEWAEVKVLDALLEPFMGIQKFLEGSYVTIAHVPSVVIAMRNILNNFPVNDDTENVLSKMKMQFNQRWGSGVEGSVWREHFTRGPRNIRKGIPKVVLLAAAVDPRFKHLNGIPSADKVQITNVNFK